MKILRNPEYRRELVFHLVITVVCIVTGFILGKEAGVLALVICALFDIQFLISSHMRYNIITGLCSAIDRILHGQTEMFVTDSKEGEFSILQSEILKMTERLKEQADYLTDEKTRLADAMADISHQLRTPLTSMNVVVTMLSKENVDAEKRIQLVRELNKTLRRIDWLIEALLKLSRLDAGTVELQTESVPAKQLILQAAEPLLIPMELKGIEFTTDIEDICFNCDLPWSVEAIGNIIKNCMEHTPEGGCVSVCVKETAIFTEIVIKDTGTGFDEKDLPHLFERFYKGSNASETSIGIGLCLAQQILVKQNATIKAGNAREGGAEFVIHFYKCTV